MKPITVVGHPRVFRVYRSTDGSWLDSDGAGPGRQWDPGDQIVFRLRK
jgi:hypothetical protein